MDTQTTSYAKIFLWVGIILIVTVGLYFGFKKLNFFSGTINQQIPTESSRVYSSLEDFQKQDSELYKMFSEKARQSLNK